MESCVHNVPAIENLSVCAGVAFEVMLVVQRGLACLYHPRSCTPVSSQCQRTRFKFGAESSVSFFVAEPERQQRLPRALCEHNKRRSVCVACGGGQICEHQKVRSVCVDCGSGSICKHAKVRSVCLACGGGQICEHQKVRSKCAECAAQKVIDTSRVVPSDIVWHEAHDDNNCPSHSLARINHTSIQASHSKSVAIAAEAENVEKYSFQPLFCTG